MERAQTQTILIQTTTVQSDKEEVDSGTNPIDPEDFKKSGFGTILMFILEY